MGQISSINFKKSFAINAEHNDRTLPPSYLIDNEKGAECNRSAEKARELKNQIISEAKEAYTRRTGQRFQAKSYEWSAVCNIKPDTTIENLEVLAKHFNDKYGFQCYQIAIHRDEGHIDENGEKQINHHAHLEFITLDKESGKNNYRRELITPNVLRRIQTETAEVLQMQRGQDKRLSGAERIEPRKYAKQKEAEKAARSLSKKATEKAAIEVIKATYENEEKLLNDKEKSEYLERLRKQYKDKGLSAEFFRELGALKKDKEAKYTQKELDEAIQKAVEADREKQKPINRQKFEQQTEKELKSYAQTTGQKPAISPFIQGLIAFLPKDGERIKQLEKALKDEQEKFKNFKEKRGGQIFKVAYELEIPAEKLKTFKDFDEQILKAIYDLKTQNNTLKTQIDIALAYSPNTYAKELEKMRQKRRKTAVILSKTRSELRESQDRVQNLLEECQKYELSIAKALEKAEEWKEKAEKFQDDLLAIERKPIQIKDPTVDMVEIENPLKKKPSKQDPDFDR
ncbi:mobilization protein [uncultured Campylobacter sp.]|uniref:mobilization protein n=1 Tax=uncultured Campylobacter sp. TaxID=218934 RepID=UPI0028E27891|nr:mobilization protein [uncultured Campylobacter sp.]